MNTQKIPNHLLVTGDLTVQGAMNIPNSAISDAQVASAAGIAATKLTHDHFEKYAQPNTAATTETRGLFIARNSGSIVEFAAGSIAIAVGAATVTIDLKKNGSSVLSAVITLDTGNSARVAELATITSANYVAGDFFEIVITATAGGGTLPTGLFVYGLFREVGAV